MHVRRVSRGELVALEGQGDPSSVSCWVGPCNGGAEWVASGIAGFCIVLITTHVGGQHAVTCSVLPPAMPRHWLWCGAVSWLFVYSRASTGVGDLLGLCYGMLVVRLATQRSYDKVQLQSLVQQQDWNYGGGLWLAEGPQELGDGMQCRRR